MSEPIQVIPQRRSMDCGVAALGMLLGCGYEAANDAVIHATNGTGAKRGLYIKELEGAARHLGKPLTRLRKYDMASATGILSVRGDGRWHFVVLKEGQIIEPDQGGQVWTAQLYLATNKMTAHTLLVKAPDLADATPV